MAVSERMTEAEAATLLLEGEACTGLGEGASFTQLEWVRREFLAKLGFEPYPGTFNLHMSGPDWEEAKRVMAREAGIVITPEPGFCAAKCFLVVVAGRITGAVVFPEIAGIRRTSSRSCPPCRCARRWAWPMETASSSASFAEWAGIASIAAPY
ncbi:MAG: CTP-dependent riboflavin kinase [Rhodocyclaceae bacterium]|nr:CTP-dependent riboflavin kinase [Rhodocyclaceae bacterium]